MGWGILPPELVEPLLAQKGNIDFGSPHFNQVLMSTVMEMGLFDRHVAARAGELSWEARRHAWRLRKRRWNRWGSNGSGRPAGCTSGCGCRSRSIRASTGRLFSRAVAEGVLYVPGECCYPQEGCPRRRNMLRLSFGVPSVEEIRRGVESLARAVKTSMSNATANTHVAGG